MAKSSRQIQNGVLLAVLGALAAGATFALLAGPRTSPSAEERAEEAAPPASSLPMSANAESDPRVAEARAALTPLKTELMGKLAAALKEGGPVHAIEVCRLEAPAIAADAGEKSGIELGRTSHKLRNPTNAPRPWVKPILDELVASPPEPGSFRTVSLEDGRLGYLEPIFVNPLCLQCHGEEIAPKVRTALREKYPEDQATGFAPGAFRGLFWAEVPPPAR